MFKKLTPDFYYDDIYAITPEQLTALGIRGLICDIDNTLVTYDDPVPTPPVLAWLEALAQTGIAVSFVSNNHADRVNTFNAGLNYFAIPDSGKPLGNAINDAMAHMGTGPSDTAVIGDQIFTDVYAGKRRGLRCFLVKPIRDKKTLFFRFKRLLERPVIRHYQRKQNVKKQTK